MRSHNRLASATEHQGTPTHQLFFKKWLIQLFKNNAFIILTCLIVTNPLKRQKLAKKYHTNKYFLCSVSQISYELLASMWELKSNFASISWFLPLRKEMNSNIQITCP